MSRYAAGLKAWFLQRITSLYLGLYILFVSLLFVVDPPADFHQWQSLMGQMTMRIATLLFFAALLLHAWVGIRDVVIDYIHPIAIRLGLLSLIGFGLLGCAVWVLQIIFLIPTQG
jgi:succinate dehydrogenase / fumarate reductase membrane anchor subunit